MRTSSAALLLLFLASAAYCAGGQKTIQYGTTAFRDAPRDEFAEAVGDLAKQAAAGSKAAGLKATAIKGTSAPAPDRKRSAEWVNTRCRETGTCDLKRFALVQSDFSKNHAATGRYFGTETVLEYETDKAGSLTRYGVAQFIRGCEFHSDRKPDGETVKTLDISRHWNGKFIIYKHPDWVQDSVTPDPLDWGYETVSPERHFYYWNSRPGRKDADRNNYYGYKKPAKPILYLHDLPGVAGLDGTSAMNISLQFRACIYKSADVPPNVPAEVLDFAKPLACLEWASSWVYNHAAGRYEQPSEIDPVCR
ncbi:MAG: hypothetical protein WCK76_08040 [Elusimicrobiota bacterium]